MQTEPLVQRQGAIRRGDPEQLLFEYVGLGDVRNATHGLAPVPLTVVQGPCEDNRQEKVQRPDSEGPKRLLDLTEDDNRDAIHHRVRRNLAREDREKAPIEADYQHGNGPGGWSCELQVMSS